MLQTGEKLIEVTFPLEAVNRDSAREKSVWHSDSVVQQPVSVRRSS